MYFSANWQVLEERVDAESAFTTDPTSGDIDGREQCIWGVRYLDDLVMHRVDGNTDGDYDDVGADAKWYHLTDAQFSTVAVMGANGHLHERVSYDPYGKARHHLLADVDGDGDSDLDDRNSIDTGRSIGSAYYNVDADFDRDGDVDMTDFLAAVAGSGAALPAGQISSSNVGSTIGWDGYVFNAETGEYTVRFRHYNTELGRWLERDPLGTRPVVRVGMAMSLAGAPYGPQERDLSHRLLFDRPSVGVDEMAPSPQYLKGTGICDDSGVADLGKLAPASQYHDGLNLYELVQSGPIDGLDPYGTCRQGDIRYTVAPVSCTRGHLLWKKPGIKWCTRTYKCKVNVRSRTLGWVYEGESCGNCVALNTPAPLPPPNKISPPDRPLTKCEQWARRGGGLGKTRDSYLFPPPHRLPTHPTPRRPRPNQHHRQPHRTAEKPVTAPPFPAFPRLSDCPAFPTTPPLAGAAPEESAGKPGTVTYSHHPIGRPPTRRRVDHAPGKTRGKTRDGYLFPFPVPRSAPPSPLHRLPGCIAYTDRSPPAPLLPPRPDTRPRTPHLRSLRRRCGSCLPPRTSPSRT